MPVNYWTGVGVGVPLPSPDVAIPIAPSQVLAYSWQAQLPLHKKLCVTAAAHNRNVAAVAVARELAGFV